MTRSNPRRPASSRAPVSRPRRVAGQGAVPTDSTVAEVRGAPAPSLEAPEAEAPTRDDGGFEARKLAPQPPSGLAALFDSRRATAILVALVVVLGLVAGGLFALDASRDEDPAKPSKQPVVIGADDATAGVDAAAKAAEKILTRSYQDYDQQVEDATALMTDAFAKEFQQTAGDVEDEFVAAKTDQQARVVAQGVVHATRTEVQALVFLNQYVSKDAGDTTYTPYRVLVTVLHTDRGWLVSGLDTK